MKAISAGTIHMQETIYVSWIAHFWKYTVYRPIYTVRKHNLFVKYIRIIYNIYWNADKNRNKHIHTNEKASGEKNTFSERISLKHTELILREQRHMLVFL